MQNSAKNSEPQDNKTRQTEEDLSSLLDSINTEIDDMAEGVAQEESTIKVTPLKVEDEYGELDPELFFKEEDLQLDLETAENSAKPSPEIQAKKEGAKTEMDASVDDKDEDEKTLAEKEKSSLDSGETAKTDKTTKSASMSNDKIRSDVHRSDEDQTSAITEESSNNLSADPKPESEMEGEAEAAGQKLEADISNDRLADLMNSRIEKIVLRKLEEQMPAIVERSILAVMEKIFLAMK